MDAQILDTTSLEGAEMDLGLIYFIVGLCYIYLAGHYFGFF